MTAELKQVYRFADFALDVSERRLLRGNQEIYLPPKTFEMLLYLVERHGHLVRKDELMDSLWADAFVTENALTKRIKEVREALGDDAYQPRYLKTFPRVGYKFIANVEAISEQAEVEEFSAMSILVREERKEKTESAEVSGIQDDAAVQDKSTRVTSLGRRIYQRPAKIASLALATIVVLVGLALLTNYLWPTRTESPASIKSIAVLPFKPLVADSRDEALELGMADTLITRLSNLRQIIVRPMSAVRNYAGREQDPIAAGRQQRVEAVLDGSIQKSRERIRVTVRLLSVGDGKQLWADKFEEKSTDLFTLQDSISEQLAGALAVKLAGEERERLTKHYTDNIEAYQLYVKGRYSLRKETEEGLTKAAEYFQQALGKDPSYALAYAGLADAYILLGTFGLVPMKESYPKAKEAATRALELDDKLGEAHSSLATVIADYYWDWPEADRRYKLGIDLNPNYAPMRSSYSWYLTRVGRFDEAIQQAKRAQELDPLSLSGNTTLGFAFLMSRQYDQAVQQSRMVAEVDPGHLSAHIILGFAYVHKKMYEEAISEFQKTKTISAGNPEMTGLLGYAYAVAGKRSEGKKALRELIQLSKQHYVSPSHIALIQAGLGEKDLAFEWLEKAHEDRNWIMGLLKVAPMFDSLRSDPHFADLLRRVGFPQ
jgi:DNA-binding winged helix-turn-helix (wHTH) protein/TolB-like protein/Tfp pilus assembly protein PilF